MREFKEESYWKTKCSPPFPSTSQQENSIYSLFILQAGLDDFVLFCFFIWPQIFFEFWFLPPFNVPQHFHFWAPPPPLHRLTTTCTYVVSWWEGKQLKYNFCCEPWKKNDPQWLIIQSKQCYIMPSHETAPEVSVTILHKVWAVTVTAGQQVCV